MHFRWLEKFIQIIKETDIFRIQCIWTIFNHNIDKLHQHNCNIVQLQRILRSLCRIHCSSVLPFWEKIGITFVFAYKTISNNYDVMIIYTYLITKKIFYTSELSQVFKVSMRFLYYFIFFSLLSVYYCCCCWCCFIAIIWCASHCLV